MARLAAHPALEPTGWGSAYPDDPWPRPLPADLPASTLALLRQRYAAQSSEPPRSMTFVTRWSRSLVTLEDHAGALVLAISHAPVAAAVTPGEPGQSGLASAPAPLAELPADAGWAVLGLPFTSAAALQASLPPPLPGPPPDELRAALRPDPGELRAALRPDPGDAEAAGSSATSAEPVTLQERAEAALGGGDLEAATQLLDRALELEPLDSSAYLARARVGAAAGRGWSALIDVTTALALARRQGLRLREMQALQTTLRDQLTAEPTPPAAASELHAVANLGALLRAGRPREVEEVAELLLTLPGRAALWWLAIGLARRERGRPERASEAFAAALASAPQLRAAHFLLGDCRRELGDLDGARQAFAQLDPPPGERPVHPSLLEVYADELLGSQAPWEAREHAFARVQLLRELGHPAQALAVTTELLRREPAAADALLAHGILLVELAQPAAALAALDRGLTALRPAERLLSEPDPLGTLQLYRAIALQSVGHRDAAEVALRHALRLSPERAAEVAADPRLAELTPVTARPPSPAGYAVLRRLARAGLADPQPSANDASDVSEELAAPLAGSATQARARDDDPLAGAVSSPDRAHLQTSPKSSARPGDAAAAAWAPGAEAPVSRAASDRPATTGPDEELIWTALREHVAELLVAALAALDADAEADSRRELLRRAARGLAALRQLAPRTIAAHAQAVRAMLEATAAALGVAAELDCFDAAP